MKRGVPPTPRNARTGEWTPPGDTCLDLSKSFSDCPVPDISASRVLLQPLARVSRAVSDDHRGARADEGGPGLQVRARPVHQPLLGEELDRGVLAADLIHGPGQ